MACNLNFNQCNSGCQFPRPIFNCRCRLLSILNSTDLSVVNPVLNPSLFLSTIFSQTVQSNEAINSVEAFLSGDSIELSNGGAVILAEGRYLISYATTGVLGSNGVFSVGINQDGFLVSGSDASISGTAGLSASLNNSAIINVTAVSSLITLINTNSVSQELTSGNITIQKL